MSSQTNTRDIQMLVQFSCSVMSNSLRPHDPQHSRPPCCFLELSPPLTGAILCLRAQACLFQEALPTAAAQGPLTFQ